MLDGVLFPGGAPDPFADRLSAADVEAQVVGTLLGHPDRADALPAGFSADVFSHQDHAEIYRLVMIDPSPSARYTVARQWAGGDPDRQRYVAGLLSCVVSPSRSHLGGIAAFVLDLHRRREARNRLRSAVEQVEELDVALGDTAGGLVSELDNLLADAEPGSVATIGDAIEAAIEAGRRAGEADGRIGLSTGFDGLDRALGGLEPAGLYVLGGRPGMGKTALGMQIALAAAQCGSGVLVVSLEMSAEQLGRRVVASGAGVSLGALKSGRLSADQAERAVCFSRDMQDVPLRICDRAGMSVEAIARQARAMARTSRGLGLVVVDHLHLVRPPPEASRMGATWGVGQVSNALKRLAKDLHVPVLALAQLNRGLESRDDKRPGLADLRQAGEIEQDADVVMLVHRPGYFLAKSPPERKLGQSTARHEEDVSAWRSAMQDADGKAELILAKVRDGASSVVSLEFDGARTRFAEASGDWR